MTCTWTEGAERGESSHLKADLLGVFATVLLFASTSLNTLWWRILIYIPPQPDSHFILVHSFHLTLFNKSWHIFNVVNMYWTASAIHVVFCNSITWPGMTHVYGCTNQMMLYGCGNQKHMLLWSRPEDVVQILHRMYSFFGFMLFPDNNRPIVNDFEEN